MFGHRRRRRAQLMQAEPPAAWSDILARRVPLVALLDDADHHELFGKMQIFLDEKIFEGCGGLTITDEIKVTIAAQACILLLHRDTEFYPDLDTILVYPHAYVSHVARRRPDGTVEEGAQARLGESWARGVVVLSWDDVVAGAADIHDGHNVVLHEFAHQLDNEAGIGDGAPALPRASMYVAWARVLGAEYAHLLDDIHRRRPTVLDPYGATNPAEFFAVATETFFEKSAALRRLHPELYEQLRLFYRQDPAALVG
ncbi:MAG: zinc-dependent peptidase [Candidatus Krumholzibacteriia bacterium]